MKVGLNTALNCQPLRFAAKTKEKSAERAATSFKSVRNTNNKVSLEEKYELAKQVIAAQSLMIDNMQKQAKTGLPASNMLNKYA